ncbi:PIG-L family deacetylase [Mucilaginibacter terrae]|uniref:LmbE family N-acetylglucosaminyl deacetylase n=1 Tax=Mucilaginibacter terrae TaxID=1955052 RepID=A0ABU3GW65_9SPHI|nr:PIG-L family deacetylase [Mucilaginibacter terrae]MDT3403841.1 LmbE family N-acetylglucosaminyl deacetylase [Mucilaginibacter terrae]
MKIFKSLSIALLITTGALAQTAPPANLSTIRQQFKKLNVLGSVLYIAAHPDDENTRLLAYLAQEKGYRTGYLALTRGDGGQNLIGNEQAELLGLIRTQELLAARRADGAEQFFSRANDFGFSKGPDETLKIWDRDKILGDMVWVIRQFKPDVMICRFPTTGEGGHGHHTSSAIITQEAFTAAADPKRYPEQLKYVQPWQAKRLLWNTFNFGGNNTISPDQFKVDVGVYNPILGKGYGEIAAESRSNHKSQGFGSARQRGQSFEYFKTILGEAPKEDLLDGTLTTWKRVKGGDDIATNLSIISKAFDADAPEKSVPELVKLRTKIEKVSDVYWRTLKLKELDNLIAACAGLWFESYAAEASYALGDSIAIRSQVLNRYSNKVKLQSISIQKQAQTFAGTGQVIPANELKTYSIKALADKLTQPYWLNAPHGIGAYTLPNDELAGNPENPDLLTVSYTFEIEGKPIHYDRKLIYKYVDPVRGELYEPIEIAPPVTATISNKVYVYSTKQPQTLQVKLKSFINGGGSISIKPVVGWQISPASISFADKKKGDEWTADFTITPIANAQNGTAEAVVTVNGKNYSLGLQRIQYEHIPNISLFPPAQAKLVNLDLKIAGKKIGYITGAGDFVADALRQIGYEVHLLTENEIMNGDLSVYDAIVTGVRAYNVDERLAFEQPKLMEYVKNGGNLVVQYNNPAGLVTQQIGPYALLPGNERVTDEFAKVTITNPQSPLLNYPNKITQTDFDGWVQERGLYFVNGVVQEYQTIFEMNDAGESPKNGSLISANYGKGRYVYTSLAFFRQLPAGVPGAYRLFVNLLSKPK